MNYILLIAGIVGLALGAIFAAQYPKFWVGLLEEVAKGFLPAFLKILQNKKKTPKEWEDWRELSGMKQSEMSPRQIDRLKELKKLNSGE